MALSNGWLKSVSCLVEIVLREYNFVLWYEIIMWKFDMRIKGSRFFRFPWRFHWFDKFKFEVLWMAFLVIDDALFVLKRVELLLGRSNIELGGWEIFKNWLWSGKPLQIHKWDPKTTKNYVLEWPQRRKFRKNFGRNFRAHLKLSFLALVLALKSRRVQLGEIKWPRHPTCYAFLRRKLHFKQNFKDFYC